MKSRVLMCQYILVSVALLLLCALPGHGQLVFQDQFSRTLLNRFKWTSVHTEGSLVQNNGLIFSKDSACSGWEKNFIHTNQAFAKTSGGKVLRFTMDVTQSENASYAAGFYPDAEYRGFGDTKNGMKYGFAGDRVDRNLLFIENELDTNNLYIFRIVPTSDEYMSYRIRVELGADNGALWQYDMGKGWQTGRDTRGKGTGYSGSAFRFFVSSYWYAAGSVKVDNVFIEHVTPTPRPAKIDYPVYPPPVNAEFNGKMDERWTNWAGGLGVTNPWSVPDFKICPGWLTMLGPAGGYGLLLRHYPFMPKRPYFPFYAELKCRYPTVRPPDGNFFIMLHLLVDVDGDGYHDDLAGLCLYLQNILATKQSQMQVVDDIGHLTGVNTGVVNLPTYWGSGDLYLRIGATSNTKLVFQYRFSKSQDWATFHTYDTTTVGKTMGFPIGCDVLGANGTSNWLSPAPKCEADHISHELDYVHFYKNASGAK